MEKNYPAMPGTVVMLTIRLFTYDSMNSEK